MGLDEAIFLSDEPRICERVNATLIAKPRQLEPELPADTTRRLNAFGV